MPLLTNIGDCECLNPDGSVIPGCVTTTFAPNAVVPCTGVVTAKPMPTVSYDCFPLVISKVGYSICTNCRCAFIGIRIKSLPANAVISLRGVPVVVNQIIAEKDNGQLVISKTGVFVGTNTFAVEVDTTCGDSADLTITVNYSNKDCAAC